MQLDNCRAQNAFLGCISVCCRRRRHAATAEAVPPRRQRVWTAFDLKVLYELVFVNLLAF